VKIAVSSTGQGLDAEVDPRFGRCQYFVIVDGDTMAFEAFENPNVMASGGAGIQSAQLVADKGAEVVLTGNCGPNAFQTLQAAGVSICVGIAGTVGQAVEQYKRGESTPVSGPSVGDKFGVSGAAGAGGGQSAPGGGQPGPGGAGGGMGGGGGMGRGMGMGMRTSMPGSPVSPNVFQPSSVPTAGQSELDQLKQQAQILQQQKQEIERRISELESGRKAAAFVQTDKCTGCGICVNVCPVNAISMNKYAVVDARLCTASAVCVSECPNGAITITQQKIGG